MTFSAHAERADRDKPTDIEADQMVADDVKQVTIFTGNVIMTQGTRVAKAAKVVLVQDPEGYQYTTLYAAPGKLASLREKRDGGPDLWTEGYGERIEYDNKTEIIKFFTRANLKRLDGKIVTDDIKGEYISYNSKSEFYQVHNTSEGKSAPGAGRVKAIIQPRDKKGS
ncbi:lipopolysaccharide transport periplasmic protein LptA [Oxalobacter sp. OttesenSCG-928-P03]|nr:lipopolysaccharide transport periplasmic protein LptA [Oxalobacter sp. OttesenSCG-928-P03]